MRYERLTFLLDGKIYYEGYHNLLVSRLYDLEDKIESGELVNVCDYIHEERANKDREIEGLQAENAALREQISKMIMPPCTLGDTLYIISFCFGDGYDEAGNAVHTIDWQISETKVDEKNFYKMCDLVRNERAFFSSEAAEARLAEMKGEKE